ncbi:hypothetical protein QLX67_05650 [Balneolaceae bacterium ANBcel3]|nr:hypothetical protein [Balneolaceae bacterium ANBcel3]
MVFWSGLFAYVGTTIHNYYKIVVVIYALALFYKKIPVIYNKHDQYVNLIFILFSVSFWTSYTLQGGGIVTILSQYLYKYGFVFLLYHGFKDIVFNDSKREYLKKALIQVLLVQVGLSVFKILIFGFDIERNVGSMEYGSGAFAVVIPMAGLFLYWVGKHGRLTQKDWIIIGSFFIIAIASGKRAPVIIFPLITLLLVGFVISKSSPLRFIRYIPLIILLLYLGARITPTLNPEREVWGSFDLVHIVNYSLQYNFGTTEINAILQDDFIATGRGGSLFLLSQPERLGFNDAQDFLFGHGLYHVAVREGGRFTGSGEYYLDHQGLVGEAIRLFYSLGLFGLLFIFLMGWVLIKTIKNKKLRYVILIYFIWDFFMYYNHFVFANSSAVLVVFTCFYANTISLTKKKNKHSPSPNHKKLESPLSS